MFYSIIRKQILNLRGGACGVLSRRFSAGARHSAAKAATGRLLYGFWLFSAVVIIIPCLFLPPEASSSGAKPPAAEKATFVEKAPDFVLKDLNGRRFRLSDFREKQPILIIFSATWCTFCREEIPHFKSIHAAYAKQGLEIVNIDIQESKEKVAKFTAKHELPYRVLLDEDGVVSGVYDIKGVPSMVLVDPNGNILCRQCQQVEPLIEKILKKR
jgi:peroxiredoxin